MRAHESTHENTRLYERTGREIGRGVLDQRNRWCATSLQNTTGGAYIFWVSGKISWDQLHQGILQAVPILCASGILQAVPILCGILQADDEAADPIMSVVGCS
jgi:hypothetical protein